MSAVIRDPPAEVLGQLEKHVRRYFRSALETAIEATWQEVFRRELGSMSVVTLYAIAGRLAEEEIGRLGLRVMGDNTRGQP